jgi:hypothetical protein
MSDTTPSRKDALKNDFSLFTSVEFKYIYKLLLNEPGDYLYNATLNEYEHQLQEKERRKLRSYVFEKEGEWMKGITNTAEGFTAEGKWTSSSQAHRILIGMARERAWLREQLSQQKQELDIRKETAKKLSDTVNEKDRTIKMLHEALELKEKTVKTLSASLKETEEKVAKQIAVYTNYKEELVKKPAPPPTYPTYTYVSEKDHYEGLLDEQILVLKYNIQGEYEEGCEVYGSWNDWKHPYPLQHEHHESNESCFYIILGDDEKIFLGKHHYKLKQNGVWIEPGKNDLVEKDSDGNTNTVLFVHV